MLDPNLRERLLALDEETPSLKAKYDKEIQAMLDQPLTPLQRYGWIAGIAFGLLIAIGCSITLIVTLFYPFSPFLYWLLVMTTIYGLCGAGYSLYIVMRGKVHLHRDRAIEMAFVWVFVAIIVFGHIIWGSIESDPARGNFRILMGLFILIIAGMGTTIRYVERTGVTIREKLLEIELSLAELKESRKTEQKEERNTEPTNTEHPNAV